MSAELLSKMKVLLVKQCCCGCSLKTGTILICVLWTLFHLLEIGGKAFGIVSQQEGRDEVGDAVGIAFAAIDIVLCALLFYGTMSKKTPFFLPWLVLNGIFIVLAVVVIPIAVIVLFVLGYHWLEGVLWIVVLIAALIQIYCFRVVFSLYTKYKAVGEVVEMADKAKDFLSA